MLVWILLVVFSILLALGGGGGVYYYYIYEETPAEAEKEMAAATETGGAYSAPAQPSDTAAGSAATTASALEPAPVQFTNTGVNNVGKYTEHKRVDWTGNDIGNTPTDNIAHCESKCDGNPTCKGFFARLKGSGEAEFCWFKDMLDPAKLKQIKADSWNDGSFYTKPGVVVPPF